MATVTNKDPARADREKERQQSFRKQFIEETPSWYRGEYHLAFMLTVTLGTIWFCWSGVDNATALEWLVIIPMLLFGNFIEWSAHRYILHRPVKGLEAIYKRHCAVHHQFFTDHDLSYSGHKDWRALLFPPFAPVAFILAAVYSYIVVYCPVVGYPNILFLGGLVLGVGIAQTRIARFAKSRSPFLMGIVGVLTGVATLYFAWAWFVKALVQYNGNLPPLPILDALGSPGWLWDTAVEINNEGWWKPSGIFQWILSIIEAGIIVIGIGLITLAGIDREVFCEECSKWCKPTETRHFRIPEEISRPLSHVEILQLEAGAATDYPRYTAEVLQCPSCESTTAIRIQAITMKIDDGEKKEETTDIPGILLRNA